MRRAFAPAERGVRLLEVVTDSQIKRLGTNTELSSIVLTMAAKLCGRAPQKGKNCRAFSTCIRSLVTPSAAVRVANEHSKAGAFFHFWPSRRVAINSLVSEIAQSEQNSTNPGGLKIAWEVEGLTLCKGADACISKPVGLVDFLMAISSAFLQAISPLVEKLWRLRASVQRAQSCWVKF